MESRSPSCVYLWPIPLTRATQESPFMLVCGKLQGGLKSLCIHAAKDRFLCWWWGARHLSPQAPPSGVHFSAPPSAPMNSFISLALPLGGMARSSCRYVRTQPLDFRSHMGHDEMAWWKTLHVGGDLMTTACESGVQEGFSTS